MLIYICLSVTVNPVSCKFDNNIWTNIPHVAIINGKPIYCRDFKSYLEKKLDRSTYHLYCCGLCLHNSFRARLCRTYEQRMCWLLFTSSQPNTITSIKHAN